MNNIFDFNRFSLLLKKELWSGNKKPLIVAGAVFGFLMIQALYMIYTNGRYEYLNFNFFPIVLFGGGFVFSSVIFNEFNDKTGTHHYLSLPASVFEKFLSKWFITAVIFPIAAATLFWTYSKIGDAIYFSFTEETFYIPWKLTNWWSIFFLKLYFVFQSIYLIGAIAFQRYTFFKTSLSLWLFGMVTAAILLTLFRIIFADFFDGTFSFNDNLNLTTDDHVIHFMENKYRPMLEYVAWLLVAPIMWTVGFYKLKEKEA